jgi:hypothetical protein
MRADLLLNECYYTCVKYAVLIFANVFILKPFISNRNYLKLVVCILLRVLDQVQGFMTIFKRKFPPEDGHKTETCSGYWIKYSNQCCVRRKPWTWPNENYIRFYKLIRCDSIWREEAYKKISPH